MSDPAAPGHDAEQRTEERSHASRRAVFSADEVCRILALADARPAWRPAEIGRPGEVDPAWRSAQLRWLHARDAPWFFQRLEAIAREDNDRYFGFDLDGFHDPLQLTRYDAREAGHYDWHTDRGTLAFGHPARKLTVVVQLSAAGDYGGGDLQVMTGREPATLDRAAGSVHVFPSFVLHRVTKVTAGTRLSLVGWIVGPALR